MSIQVKNLLKEYGSQKAVNNISFSVNKGEIVGFLGPNGAGKSTTMKIITGYLEATSGEAFVCGINVKDSPLQTKKKIGYLPELNALYYDMYVREYLAFVAEIHQLNNIAEAVEKAIHIVALNRESSKRIGQLSKGYKQRVGLAAALIHDPEVLILDEPTTGLDPNQIIEIREVIRKQGIDKTVLFSSHILQEVEAVCDRIIIINRGNLVLDNTLNELRAQSPADVVQVKFKEEINEALLEQLPSTQTVMKVDNGWQITTSNTEATKKEIFEMSLQHQLNIISLHNQQQSLEDIFRTLTT